MKITYLKLKNFIGFYAGMNLKEIEIDFSKSKNKFILIAGSNGSGKSTLQSVLHPFRETLDDRKKFIIEGEKGYKEIRYKKDDDEYIIKHYYGSNSSYNKSFFMKNGEELNEKGNVGDVIDLIKKEFYLDKNFFKISRLSSNIDGFVDSTTSKRNGFISSYIDIQDYLSSYKIVKEKFNGMKKEITSLTDNNNKLGNLEDLKDNFERIKKILSTDTINLKKLEEEFNKNNGILETLLKEVNRREIRDKEIELEEIKELEESLEKAKSKIESTLKINEDSDLVNLIDKASERLYKTENKLESLNSDIENFYSKINENKLSISKKQAALKEVDDEEDIEEVKTFINKNKKVIIQLEEELTKEKYKGIDLTESSADIINKIRLDMKTLEYFSDDIISIKSKYTEEDISKIEDIRLRNTDELFNRKEYLDDEYDKFCLKINDIISRRDLLDILDKRPSECKINSCKFIGASLEYKKEYDTLNELEKRKKELQEEIEEIELKIEKAVTENEIREDIQKLLKKYSNTCIFGKMTFEEIKEYLTSGVTKLDNISEKLERKENLAINIYNLDEEKKVYNNLKEKLKNIEKNNKYKDVFIQEINDLKLENETLMNKISTLHEEIEKRNANKQKFKKVKDLLSYYSNIINKQNKNVETHKELESYLDKTRVKIDKIEKLEISMNRLKREIDTLQNTIEKMSIDNKEYEKRLILKEDYIKRITKLDEQLKDYSIVKEALDPNKGIPLVFIDNFLKSITETANNLLDLAYNGRFKIKFQISSKEFLIQVYKNDGTMLDDIKLASQGEIALTTISLSLSLIQTIMSDKYNILSLDEIDGPLDTENRKNFISILDKQIDDMNIEQVFIISHNNEFDYYPVDLILLKNHGINTNDKMFMNGKQVLFNYEDK